MTTRIQKLTEKLTAFRTWERLELALASGYTPTIRPTTKAAREFAAELRSRGYRVWTGANEPVPAE